MSSRSRPSLFSCVLLCAAAGPAAAQTLGQGSDTDVPWLRLVLALLLCLGLAATAIWAVRTRLPGQTPQAPASLNALVSKLRLPIWQARATSGPLQVINSVSLPHQASATLLDCDGRRYLVVSSLQGRLEIIETSPAPGGGDEAP